MNFCQCTAHYSNMKVPMAIVFPWRSGLGFFWKDSWYFFPISFHSLSSHPWTLFILNPICAFSSSCCFIVCKSIQFDWVSLRSLSSTICSRISIAFNWLRDLGTTIDHWEVYCVFIFPYSICGSAFLYSIDLLLSGLILDAVLAWYRKIPAYYPPTYHHNVCGRISMQMYDSCLYAHEPDLNWSREANISASSINPVYGSPFSFLLPFVGSHTLQVLVKIIGKSDFLFMPLRWQINIQ